MHLVISRQSHASLEHCKTDEIFASTATRDNEESHVSLEHCKTDEIFASTATRDNKDEEFVT